jgi:tRNA-specific 2-thiouridylase
MAKLQDLRKDQSYFLFSLRQDQLARTCFPLGELTKADTREIARESSLKTAEKEESMEICFVPDNDYGRFLQQAKLVAKHRGEIVDVQGRVLGHHDGIEFFTIGQRRGIGIAAAKPLYVLDLDPVGNRVVVGDEAGLERDSLVAERCNWIVRAEPPAEIEALVKIRYNHAGTRATIRPVLKAPRRCAFMSLRGPSRQARLVCFTMTTWCWVAAGFRVDVRKE